MTRALITAPEPALAMPAADGAGLVAFRGELIRVGESNPLTREDLLADRTTEPALTNEQFARALLLATSEVTAERFVKKRRRRGRPARHRDLLSEDTDGLLTGADVAELLAGG